MRRLAFLFVLCSAAVLAAAFSGQFSAILGTKIAFEQQGAQALPPGLPTYRVTDFGAIPNDDKGDFDGMQRAAAAVCRTGGTLIYPPGVYLINRIKVSGGPNKNAALDIVYRNCNNVLISGDGAVIRVNGNFTRSADYMAGGWPRSYNNGVIPFRFEESHNFTLEGFEIYGGVDQMSRDPTVAETSNAGVVTVHCQRYTLRNLNVHHFHSDGIYIGGSRQPDDDVLIEHVSAHNNARTALAVIQARNVLARDSDFSSTGRTGATYGYHAPGAGVDVEPDWVTDPPTENIIFDRCTFKDNIVWSLVAGFVKATGAVSITNSELLHPPDSKSPLVFSFSVPGKIANNVFTVPAGHQIPLTYGPVTSRITYQGNTFNLGRLDGLGVKYTGYNISFMNNRINVASALRGPLLLRNLGVVQDNVITIAGAPAGSGAPFRNLVSYDGTVTLGQNEIKTVSVLP